MPVKTLGRKIKFFEPCCRGHQCGTLQREPPDLLYRITCDLTAQGPADELASQTMTQNRDAVTVCNPDQLDFSMYPWQVIIYAHGATHKYQPG